MNTSHLKVGKKYSPLRVHLEDDQATERLSGQLYELTETKKQYDFVIICIGTDRSTGDSLGPFVGSILAQHALKHFHTYGTLEKPIHAVNLREQINHIKKQHPRSFILAIDACLGRSANVGTITLSEGPIQPGAAVQKKLPTIGDAHIAGIVNIGGMMEYVVLQNTRLHTVIQMAEMIAAAIIQTDAKITLNTRPSSFFGLKKLGKTPS